MATKMKAKVGISNNLLHVISCPGGHEVVNIGGKTPIKGVDYFTPEEIEEIARTASEMVEAECNCEEEVVSKHRFSEFPSVGDRDVIYKAEDEKKLYQWNPTELKYEEISSGGSIEIGILDGGNAEGFGEPIGITLINGGNSNGTD